jgi:hypothetical protein
MRAIAVLRTPDGVEHEVGHGDLVGRTPSARVLIDDPRISEAHAIVSLRRGRLHLLALRRLLAVHGKTANEVALRAGLAITLADELALHVTRVAVPERVRALRGAGIGTRILPQIASLVGSPPHLVNRLDPDARAVLWSTGDAWRLRLGAGEPHAFADPVADHAFELDGVTFTLTSVAIDDAGPATTIAGSTAGPIRLVAFYDSVQIFRRNHPALTIGGTSARILSELVACAGPTHWEVLAGAVWLGEAIDLPLRHRWDVALGRLRARLREAGVRDLLRSDGTGQLALELYEGDEVDDRT